jgi:hypothetical protein
MNAAVAELAQLTVLHVDQDDELIASDSWGRSRTRDTIPAIGRSAFPVVA